MQQQGQEGGEQSGWEPVQDVLSPSSFKLVNRVMVLCWRLGLGRLINCSPSRLGRIMVLRVTGRKSGQPRLTPLNYGPGDGEVYCVAGYGEKSHWLRNLQDNPDLEVWLPEGSWSGRAVLVEEPEARLKTLRRVLQNSGFAARSLAGVDPFVLSDEELEQKTAEYRVVRIVLLGPAVGPGGPGDLAWLPWLALGLALLVVSRW